MIIKLHFLKILTSIAIAIFLYGCFPEDDVQPLIPFEGVVGTCSQSIYEYQTFFSLEDSTEVSNNLLSDWDLGFESGINGQHVIINSGDQLYATNLGPVDFVSTTQVPDSSNWIYDASSGNTDSLVINGWVNTATGLFTYSQNVYAIRKVVFNEVVFQKKFKLIELTPTYYKIIIGDMESTSPDTIEILKDNTVNYTKVSIRDTYKVQTIEPNSLNWDLCFTRYATIIPDDFGVLTPYYVNGAIINHNKIKVAKYYITTDMVPTYENDTEYEDGLLKQYFESNFEININDSEFSNKNDIIGYDWKEYTPNANQKYTTNKRKVYIIKDIFNDKSYKLRFISFTDKPLFQYGEI